MWVLVVYRMLLKSNSRRAPRSDASRAARTRPKRYRRRRSAFQRFSQSTCMDPGDAKDVVITSPQCWSTTKRNRSGGASWLFMHATHRERSCKCARAGAVRFVGLPALRARTAAFQYHLTPVNRLCTLRRSAQAPLSDVEEDTCAHQTVAGPGGDACWACSESRSSSQPAV